jgi:hypothetical protein
MAVKCKSTYFAVTLSVSKALGCRGQRSLTTVGSMTELVETELF